MPGKLKEIPGLRSEYLHNYNNVFSAKNSAILAKHGLHELAIDLMPEKRPPYSPLYSLLVKKSEILKDYIHTNLE